ncbi:U-box domain-containing protein [Legionella clemsonensis]|uniref:U-box domain protein n=1 Tax=Legionella clemsonensis TaxID=1867846 RepID=A0A222P666_9GAMM|nr:U-box domain-containing protein [Legionella clemsonensis]ASQ47329.1 U-box domain protein [Legionella clemsonensis]
MLYVIVNLPPQIPFNPFVSPNLFDVFNQIKNLSRQGPHSYITYETNSQKVNEYISNVATRPSRCVVLKMQGNHRYEIPQQRIEFMHALDKADFYVGAFHKAIPLPKVAKSTASVTSSPPAKQSAGFAKAVRYPSGQQRLLNLSRSSLKLPLDYAQSYSSLPITPKIVSRKTERQSPTSINKGSKPVVPQAPRQQIPSDRPVQPAPNRVAPPPRPPIPPRAVIPRQEVEAIRAPLPEIPVAALPVQPVGPLSHVPYPDIALKATATKAAEKLGEDLPMECMDPITLEPLTDPVEINRRVYNRETLEGMIKDGQFNDPFTREIIDPATAKPAPYMLEAISQHIAVIKGEEPPLVADHKDSHCIPLKSLFEQWEEVRKGPANLL